MQLYSVSLEVDDVMERDRVLLQTSDNDGVHQRDVDSMTGMSNTCREGECMNSISQ